MPDRVVQSCCDGDGSAGQSMHCYQSVWMAHWKQTSCREAPHGYNRISLPTERNSESQFHSVLAVALSARENLSRECHFQCAGVSQSPQGPANTFIVVGDSSLALAGPCQENITRSTQRVPYRFNRGKTPVLSFKSRQEKHNQLSSVLACKERVSSTNFTTSENEHDNYGRRSAFLVCEKKLGDHSASENFRTSFLRKSNASLLLHEPLGQRGVKLQSLDSSTDSEAKDSSEDIKPPEVRLKNGSAAAETDTMDMDNFREQNDFSGVNSSPSNKNIFVGQNLPFQAMIAAAGEEVERRWAVTRLPEEIPTLLPRLKPRSRCLKRLRLSAADSFGHGTKCSNFGETSSKLFGKIMKTSKCSSSSQQMFHEGHDKEEMAAARTAILLRKGESSSLCLAKKDQDILLSHSWIQRWCHNRAASQQKKREVVVVCEPLTKVKFDELQTKQFPSIAAMALMGKAINGFQRCEFQRRGSFLVWNTKGF